MDTGLLDKLELVANLTLHKVESRPVEPEIV